MSGNETRQVSRRTVVGAAWAAPVIVAAVSVPAAAASEDPRLLSIETSPPSQYENRTSFVIRVTNNSSETIPAGDLIAILPNGAEYWFSGFSGDVSWNYGPDDPSGNSLTFAYNAPIAAGDTAGPLLLILGKTDPSQTTPPVATLTFTATGFQSASTGLSIVY